jgi:hypothetical protein
VITRQLKRRRKVQKPVIEGQDEDTGDKVKAKEPSVKTNKDGGNAKTATVTQDDVFDKPPPRRSTRNERIEKQKEGDTSKPKEGETGDNEAAETSKEGAEAGDEEFEWEDVDDRDKVKAKEPSVETNATPGAKAKSVANKDGGNAKTATVTQDDVFDKAPPRRSTRTSPQKRPQLPKATIGLPKNGPKSASKAARPGARSKKKPGKRPVAIIRRRGRAKVASDDENTDDEDEEDEEVIVNRLAQYFCADRSSCVLGMQQPIRPAIDTKCRKCNKALHIECGYPFQARRKKDNALMRKNAKHRVCMYCEKDEEPSDDEVHLPAPSGPGIVSKTVAHPATP